MARRNLSKWVSFDIRPCCNSSVLPKVMQCYERENQGGDRNRQWSRRASPRLPPIRRGEKKYGYQYYRDN
jgi:hypothetical protein